MTGRSALLGAQEPLDAKPRAARRFGPPTPGGLSPRGFADTSLAQVGAEELHRRVYLHCHLFLAVVALRALRDQYVPVGSVGEFAAQELAVADRPVLGVGRARVVGADETHALLVGGPELVLPLLLGELRSLGGVGAAGWEEQGGGDGWDEEGPPECHDPLIGGSDLGVTALDDRFAEDREAVALHRVRGLHDPVRAGHRRSAPVLSPGDLPGPQVVGALLLAHALIRVDVAGPPPRLHGGPQPDRLRVALHPLVELLLEVPQPPRLTPGGGHSSTEPGFGPRERVEQLLAGQRRPRLAGTGRRVGQPGRHPLGVLRGLGGRGAVSASHAATCSGSSWSSAALSRK